LVECIPLLKNLHGIEDILVENSYWDSALLGSESLVDSGLIERAAIDIGLKVSRLSKTTVIVQDSAAGGGAAAVCKLHTFVFED
jgi:hypothetical protein